MVANRFQLLLNASWHDPAQSGEIVHLFAHRPMSNNTAVSRPPIATGFQPKRRVGIYRKMSSPCRTHHCTDLRMTNTLPELFPIL